MTEVTLKIPDGKLSFFIELVNSLGYECNVATDEIPEEHKVLVRERIQSATENDYVSWENARKKLKFK